MPHTVATVTADAVEAATGRDWDAWFAYLDRAVTTDATHPELVAAVRNAGVDTDWWQQRIATGYASHHCDQQVETKPDTGVEVGVQRTLPVRRAALWDHLLGAGVATWLGEVDDFVSAPGSAFQTADGTTGEVRRIAEGEQLCLAWQPNRLPEPATLQVTLACPGDTPKPTVLRAHLAHLPDATAREPLRRHWQAVLDRIHADLTRDR